MKAVLQCTIPNEWYKLRCANASRHISLHRSMSGRDIMCFFANLTKNPHMQSLEEELNGNCRSDSDGLLNNRQGYRSM